MLNALELNHILVIVLKLKDVRLHFRTDFLYDPSLSLSSFCSLARCLHFY